MQWTMDDADSEGYNRSKKTVEPTTRRVTSKKHEHRYDPLFDYNGEMGCCHNIQMPVKGYTIVLTPRHKIRRFHRQNGVYLTNGVLQEFVAGKH